MYWIVTNGRGAIALVAAKDENGALTAARLRIDEPVAALRLEHAAAEARLSYCSHGAKFSLGPQAA